VFLVPALALVVAAPAGPDQGCPSPRQITDALNARIPDVISVAGDPAAGGGLRLSVTGTPGAAPLRIEITDASGEPRLQRTLQPSDRGRGADCAALAETVALIVDRYLHEVGYELPPSPPPPPVAPPPPPSPPPEAEAALPAIVSRPSRSPPPPGGTRIDIVAGGAWRGASTGSEEEVTGGVGVDFAFGGRRVGAVLTGGMAPTRETADATATLQRFPVHLALYLGLPIGPGQLEPGIGAGIDWLAAARRDGPRDLLRDNRLSPGADLALGYRLFLGEHFFLRAGASMAVAKAYHFVTKTETLFETPRTFFRAALDLGVSFR